MARISTSGIARNADYNSKFRANLSPGNKNVPRSLKKTDTDPLSIRVIYLLSRYLGQVIWKTETMNLLDRYLQGEYQQVYEGIQNLGEAAFEPDHYPIVEAVLRETFKRVSYNLEVIYAELTKVNYCFTKKIKYDFQKPLLKPSPDTEKFLRRLDAAVEKIGYVPLSLKLFYKIVGSCNFAWDFEEEPKIPWEGSDPLQIAPLTDLLSELDELGEGDEDYIDLQVSADYLHKDNISGGAPYSIQITQTPSIDSLFLNEEHNTTFINYLRLTFENGGFSRAPTCMGIDDFVQFQKIIKPKLYKI